MNDEINVAMEVFFRSRSFLSSPDNIPRIFLHSENAKSEAF